MTPKITIDNFQRAGLGATYFLQNFDTNKVGNNNVLSTEWYTQLYLNNTTTGFTNVGTTKAMANVMYGSTQNVAIFNGTYMHLVNPAVLASSGGLIRTISETGSGTSAILASNYPDILSTKEEYILYSTAHHLGNAIQFTCGTGTSSSKLVDAAGKNFGTLGVTTATDGSKTDVWNVTKGLSASVAALATTTSTNDSLTIGDVGANHQAGDICFVFVEGGWTGSANWKFNVSNAVDMHFRGQSTPANWRRQIALWGSEYFILNGNYLASLSSALTTWSATAKQLYDKHQAMCIGVNNDKILVGADYSGRGALMLWDGWSNGWLSALYIPQIPNAIKEYNDGWIVLAGNKLFYTNGYQIQDLAVLPDGESWSSFKQYSNFNSLEIVNNKVLVSSANYGKNRLRNGICVYDLEEKGWTFIPLKVSDGGNCVSGTISSPLCVNQNSTYGFQVWSATTNAVNYIQRVSTVADNSVGMFYVKLPSKMRVSQVEVNLSAKTMGWIQSISGSPTVDVYVSYGDGRRGLWRDIQCGTPSTTTTITNISGVTYPAYVGQEVLIVDDNVHNTNGTTGGDRTWITQIADAGTATETWTVSPALTTALTGNSNILVSDMYSAGKQTITFNTDLNFLKTLKFDLADFFSDKLWIQVYITTTGSTLYPVDIHSINVY